jgi:hypothetical protein
LGGGRPDIEGSWGQRSSPTMGGGRGATKIVGGTRGGGGAGEGEKAMAEPKAGCRWEVEEGYMVGGSD